MNAAEFAAWAKPFGASACVDFATAAQVHHQGFADGCKGCKARGLARIFLRKGERGRKLRMACEQFDLTPQDVAKAWAADAMSKESTT